ncbi:amino acid permease [Halotalea alkalilenta]|uniref:amino acid permease n=1 Tax=Halotalea alkalilenta TaxID=376489 RepID=UPI000487080A|nr:amino acid permease [Halotalea alkalilenta]
MSLFRKKRIEVMTGANARKSELKKVLGATDLIMLGLGAMVGTGIFVLTGVGAVQAGPALALSFILAASACALAALCYSEFASMIPVAGSGYTYSYATLGELVAWIVGWSLIAEYGLATAAVSVGWSGYFQSLIGGFGLHLPTALTAAPGVNAAGETTLFNLPAFVIMMAITSVLALGIRESKRINNLLVVIKIAVILLVIAVGIWYVKPENFEPYAPFGVSGVVSAAALVFFAFLGFDAVSSAAEEVRQPQRDLPIGLIGSLLICAVLYALVATIATGIVPFADFRGVDDPIALVFQRAGIDWLAGLVSLAAVTGMMTVILVMGYGLTRVVFAMSRDGLMPGWMSKVDDRQVPVASTWLLGTLSALIAATVPLSALAELINMGTLLAFTIISLSVPVLRRTRPDLKRAFKVPAPWVLGPLSVVICLILMFNLALETWIAFMIWLAIGLVFYFGYSRRHAKLENLH